MAPEVTTTTVWPPSRAAASSAAQPGHRLGRHRRRPDLHDGDHASPPQVKVMAPTVTSSPSRAPARGQRAVDPEAAQPAHHLGLRAGVGEVGERHRPLGGPARTTQAPARRDGRRPLRGRAGAPPLRRRRRRGARRRAPRAPARPAAADEVVHAGARGRREHQVALTRLARRPPTVRLAARRRCAVARAARAGTTRARRAGPRSCSDGGSPPTSGAPRSRRTTRTRARSMWRRNWCPSPLPPAAPSTRPGMSAMTNSVPSCTPPTRTTPRCGSSVVKG